MLPEWTCFNLWSFPVRLPEPAARVRRRMSLTALIARPARLFPVSRRLSGCSSVLIVLVTGYSKCWCASYCLQHRRTASPNTMPSQHNARGLQARAGSTKEAFLLLSHSIDWVAASSVCFMCFCVAVLQLAPLPTSIGALPRTPNPPP